MFDAGLTLSSLRDCLTQIEPVRLLGMELLKQHSAHPQGQWFPAGIRPLRVVRYVTGTEDQGDSVPWEPSDGTGLPLMPVDAYDDSWCGWAPGG